MELRVKLTSYTRLSITILFLVGFSRFLIPSSRRSLFYKFCKENFLRYSVSEAHIVVVKWRLQKELHFKNMVRTYCGESKN